MALQFAISDCANSWGLAQTAEIAHNASIAEARDCDGKMNTMQAYSVEHTAQVNLLVTGSLPTAGSEQTYGPVTGLVTNVTISEANTEFQSGTVNIRTVDESDHIVYS